MNFLSLLSTIGMLMLRPTALGSTVSSVGIFVIFIASILKIYSNGRVGWLKTQTFDINSIQVLLALALWGYSISLTAILQKSNFDYAWKATALVSISVICAHILQSDRTTSTHFFSIFAKLNGAIGWSILISTLLIPVLGYDKIKLLTFENKGYEGWDFNGDILFPFSLVYGYLSEYGIYRFSGFSREVGIAQAFFAWSFVFISINNGKPFWRLGCVLGVLFCGSSGAFLTLGLSYGLLKLSKRNRTPIGLLVMLIAAAAAIALTIYAPGVGLQDKQETHLDSQLDREFALSFAMNHASELWFGNGLYYLYTPYDGMGINAISSIYYIGIIGVCLYVAIFIAPLFFAATDKFIYLALISPLLLTALFLQPLIDAPLVYVLIMYIPTVERPHTNQLR
ncbi:hypothetical protein [Aquabacterium sp.]|uniref:hypothetical protein n=1 Tax=Aquabacterium sp. TaxID=1872578 RepID=UPI0035B0B18A